LRLAAIQGALVAKQRDHHKVLHQATKDKAATVEETAGTRVDATGIRDQALQRENSLTRHLPKPRSPTLPLPLRPLLHLRQTLRAKAKAKREMAKARAKAKAKGLRCNQMGHHGLRHDHAGITSSVTEKAAPSSTMPGQPTPSLGLPQPLRRRRRLLLPRRHLPLRPRRAPVGDEGETTHPTLRQRHLQHSTSTLARTQEEKGAEGLEGGATAEHPARAIVVMIVTVAGAAATTAATAAIADDEKLLRRLPGCLCSLEKSPEI
jgi:hypothetical protein